AALEKVQLIHGDLHGGNILVLPHRPGAMTHQFWVIDFIGVPSLTSPELEVPTDIQNFRAHLIQAAVIACERHRGYSARLLLGERVFRVLEGLRSDRYQTFGD